MILPILFIATSSLKGRGVFSSIAIPAHTTVEVAPVLVLSAEDRAHAEKTMLYNYIFEWGEEGTQAIVALGYVSIYNHAIEYNCTYEMDFDTSTITITTSRDIAAGEELFINYNPNGEEAKPVWFEMEG
jgi:SET domain-containing protein